MMFTVPTIILSCIILTVESYNLHCNSGEEPVVCAVSNSNNKVVQVLSHTIEPLIIGPKSPMTSACDVVEGKTGIRVLDDCPIPQLRQLHRSEQDGTLQNGNEKLAMVQPVDPLATEEFHSEGPAARAWLGDSGELIVSEFNKKRILKMGKDNKYKWAPLVGQRREAFFFQHNGKTLLFYFASTTKRKVYAILRKWKDYH